jgi:CHAT domain-containing protein
MALSNLSLIYQKLGQWDDAKQVINESLELLETQPKTKERSRILAQTLDIQGQLQRELGQPEEALETWQKAADLYTQIENKDGATQNQINQVLALQDLGLYPRACNTLLAVLELDIQDCDQLSRLTKSELTEKLQVFQNQTASLLKVQGLRHLGEVLQVLGQPIHSQILLEASLNLTEQLEPSPDRDSEIAGVHLSLGNTARVRRNFEEALQHYQRAAESAIVTTKIRAQLNQLSLLVKRQSWSEVPNLVSKIQSSLNELPASRTAVEDRINLAQSLICFKEPTLSDEEQERSSPILQHCILTREEEKSLEKNALPVSEVPNWEEITKIVTAAVEQAKTLGNKRAEAHALGYLGGTYQQMGKWSEAQDLTKQALDLASAFDAPEIAYRWQWQLGRLRQIQEDEQGAIAAYTAAFQTLQSLRGDLVAINPEVQFTFRDSVEPVYREYVDLLLPPEKPSQDNLKRVRDAIEALQLAELDDFFRDACVEAKPEEVDKVIEEAKKPTAVLYGIILKDRLEVILKLPEQENLERYRKEISQEELESNLKELIVRLNDRMRFPSEVQEFSQKVYEWLIRPAEADLQNSGVKTLVFVLDGLLRNIPMAVLYDKDSQEYLVEKYPIALAPGLQLLSPRALAEVQLNALTAGLSKGRIYEEENRSFKPLHHVPQELKQIQDEVPTSYELLDGNFLNEELQQQLKTARFTVTHLATHGEFNSDPEKTFIATWNKLLKVKDLDNLLRIERGNESIPIELLVLSACQTAVGDNRATLGMAGVAVRAGARSTLATLWSVNDESTAFLMSKFYHELVSSNETKSINKAEALQKAQQALLQNQAPAKKWERPYYWASFILLGNWL